MMKVGKNSWHYRVWAYKRGQYKGMTPPNLCSYFWMIVGKLLIGIPFIAISPLLGMKVDKWEGLGVKNEWHFGIAIFTVWATMLYSYLFLPITIISEIAFMFSMWFFIMFLFFSVKEYLEMRFPILKKPLWQTKPRSGDGVVSLIVETVRAKKDRVCPMIEVIE
jgi:hypothetical protein